MTAASLAGQAVVALENARLHQIVERQALVDGLTGLANRRQADAALATELTRAERLGGPVGLILADVDDFKLVNDRHGHPTGDIVLRDLAQALRETVREIDTAARWGGEEFAVILPGTDLMGAAQVAERVRQALSERGLVSAEGAPLHVTASFGVAASEPTTTHVRARGGGRRSALPGQARGQESRLRGHRAGNSDLGCRESWQSRRFSGSCATIPPQHH